MPSPGCSRTRAERSTLPHDTINTRRVYHEKSIFARGNEKHPRAAGQARACMDVRLAAYEDTGLPPERVVWMKEVVEAAFDNDTSRIERAHNLHVADRDGRVVVLPCKVGDKLYRVFAGEIFEHRVGSMKYFAIQGKWDIETYPFLPSVESGIGKTIFLTREEAEKALREMEGRP